MKRKNLSRTLLIALVIVAGVEGTSLFRTEAAAQTSQSRARDVPMFEVDPLWPKVPAKWKLGDGEFRDGGAWQERRFHRPRRQSYREHCQHAADHQGLPTGTGSPPRRDDGEVADAVPYRIDAIGHIGTQTCSAE
jgi:hypothetical protein